MRLGHHFSKNFFLKTALTFGLVAFLFTGSALPAQAAKSLIAEMICAATWTCGDVFGFPTPMKIAINIAAGVNNAVTQSLIWFAASIAYIGLWFASLVASSLLTIGEFTTNSFVRTGWPFLQGVANLGFIITLLYIAFSTVTGLGNYGAQRMLPRLLIAALLINFSLVIGGVIIDASRVFMAGMLRLMGNPGITNLGISIAASSRSIYDARYDRPDDVEQQQRAVFIISNQPINPFGSSVIDAFPIINNAWNNPIYGYNEQAVTSLIFVTALLWVIFIGLIVLTVVLFIRYIMLVLLLMVSPLAYLAIAFPGLQNLQQMWWKQFIKYVLSAPIILFIMVLLPRVIDIGDQIATPIIKTTATNPFAQYFVLFGNNAITAGLFIALCIAAAKTGTQLGGVGAAAALNFGKKAALWGSGAGLALGGAKLAGKGAQAVGSAAARGVKNYAGDATGVFRTAFRNRLKESGFGWLVPAKRDSSGKLKPGEKSWAKDYAQRAVGASGFDPKEAKKRAETREAEEKIENLKAVFPAGTEFNPANFKRALLPNLPLNHPLQPVREYIERELKEFMKPYNLSQSHMGKGLGDTFITAVAQSGNEQQVRAIISDKNMDYLRSLDGEGRAKLLEAIEKNIRPDGTALKNQDRMIEDLLRRFKTIDDE